MHIWTKMTTKVKVELSEVMGKICLELFFFLLLFTQTGHKSQFFYFCILGGGGLVALQTWMQRDFSF